MKAYRGSIELRLVDQVHVLEVGQGVKVEGLERAGRPGTGGGDSRDAWNEGKRMLFSRFDLEEKMLNEMVERNGGEGKVGRRARHGSLLHREIGRGIRELGGRRHLSALAARNFSVVILL